MSKPRYRIQFTYAQLEFITQVFNAINTESLETLSVNLGLKELELAEEIFRVLDSNMYKIIRGKKNPDFIPVSETERVRAPIVTASNLGLSDNERLSKMSAEAVAAEFARYEKELMKEQDKLGVTYHNKE